MRTETQSKALAGAAAALVASLIPLLVSVFTGTSISVADIQGLGEALTLLASSGVALLVGWATVYFSPRNKPVEPAQDRDD